MTIKISKYHKENGFSLIEIMVVISIIAILSSISIFALNEARISGRNAKRKADLSQIASALELYKADCNFYPSAIPPADSQFTGCTSNVYIEVMPDDPDDGNDYSYSPSGCVGSNCTSFKLWTALETSASVPSYCGAAPGGCGEACNYCVTNP